MRDEGKLCQDCERNLPFSKMRIKNCNTAREKLHTQSQLGTLGRAKPQRRAQERKKEKKKKKSFDLIIFSRIG